MVLSATGQCNLVIEEKPPLGKRGYQRVGRDGAVASQQHYLGRLLAGSGDLSVTKSLGGLEHLCLAELGCGHVGQSGSYGFLDVIRIGQSEFDEIVKAAIQGFIETIAVVGGGNDEAVAVQFFS